MKFAVFVALLVVIAGIWFGFRLGSLESGRSPKTSNRPEAESFQDSKASAIGADTETISDRSAAAADASVVSSTVNPESSVSSHFPDRAVLDSLHGVMDLRALLEAASHYASFPLNLKVDLENSINDDLPFPLQVDEPGVQAFLDVQKDPSIVGEKTVRNYTIRIHRIPTQSPYLVEGSVRDGLRITVAISRDQDGNAISLSVMTYLRTALGESWEQGIDAYHGEFVEGLIFRIPADASPPYSCSEVKIVDGKYQSGALPAGKFCTESSLVSKEQIDELNALVGKLAQSLK